MSWMGMIQRHGMRMVPSPGTTPRDGDDPTTRDAPWDNPRPGSTRSMDTPAPELRAPTLRHCGAPAQDTSPTEPSSIRFGFNRQLSITATPLPLPRQERESAGGKLSGIHISELVKPLWQYPTPVSPHHAGQGGISMLEAHWLPKFSPLGYSPWRGKTLPRGTCRWKPLVPAGQSQSHTQTLVLVPQLQPVPQFPLGVAAASSQNSQIPAATQRGNKADLSLYTLRDQPVSQGLNNSDFSFLNSLKRDMIAPAGIRGGGGDIMDGKELFKLRNGVGT